MVHDVRLDGTDDIGMILFAVASFHGGDGHHFLGKASIFGQYHVLLGPV